MAIALSDWHVVNRFRSLMEPCNIRRENLEADYSSLYRFPQNRERLAVWEEKLSAVKILYRLVLCCFTYVLFLDRKIPNISALNI